MLYITYFSRKKFLSQWFWMWRKNLAMTKIIRVFNSDCTCKLPGEL